VERAEEADLGAEVSRIAGDLKQGLTALREQLGLKLQPEKVQIQSIVIDHIEKPSEN
jgi:uncharacterized protein (TIGR03435 family)